MQVHDFLQQVQSRADLSNQDEALRATQATFETLAERLNRGETGDLAAQLPKELSRFLQKDKQQSGERFLVDEFIARVSRRANVDETAGKSHASAVIQVLQEAVSAGEIRNVAAQLSPDYACIFNADKAG